MTDTDLDILGIKLNDWKEFEDIVMRALIEAPTYYSPTHVFLEDSPMQDGT
ncbi:MAG: hypothetical protein ACYC6R_02055 [Anaerolineales bacterium]